MSQKYPTSPLEMVRTAYRHRGLIASLVRREVAGRYRGSVLGILWSVVQPILMLTVYTFVFSFVFKARWRSGSDSQTEFALVLFAGLIIFNLVAECLNRAPGLVLANPNFVKKVVFPLEILPLVSIGTALFHALVNLSVWLVAYALFYGVPHATIVLFPFTLVSILLFIGGLSWAIASLGVYVRDVAQLIGMAMTVMLFLSPIFYPVEALPSKYQPLFLLNPLTPAIEQTREVLFWGRVPDLSTMLVYLVLGGLTAWGGFAWFQKTRSGFADVL